MNRESVEEFEKIQAQVKSIYDEACTLSKKSPNDGVNKFKLNMINKILVKANDLLGDDYIPIEDFALFSEDDIPSNSDVTFVFSQYLTCLEKLRSDNIKFHVTRWVWIIEGEPSTVVTIAPEKLKKK